MAEMNHIFLFGRVVKDAELKKTASGLSVAVFSIANNRSVKKSDGTYESKGNFFPLAVYGGYAEKILRFLKKGQKLNIEGFLKQDKWEKDGAKRSATSIGIRSIQFIFDPKTPNAPEQDTFVTEEDIPDDESFEMSEEQMAGYGEIYS